MMGQEAPLLVTSKMKIPGCKIIFCSHCIYIYIYSYIYIYFFFTSWRKEVFYICVQRREKRLISSRWPAWRKQGLFSTVAVNRGENSCFLHAAARIGYSVKKIIFNTRAVNEPFSLHLSRAFGCSRDFF